MPVTTRYRHYADLYMSVFEQPLLLDNILSHLSVIDVVHLKMTGGQLVNEPRFKDTVDVFLESEYEDHKVRIFLRNINEMINQVQETDETQDKCRRLNELYDYMLDHMYYINNPDSCWVAFNNMLEQRLIRDTESIEYGMYALYYLSQFFGIQVQAYNDDSSGGLVEYIRDRHGNMHRL